MPIHPLTFDRVELRQSSMTLPRKILVPRATQADRAGPHRDQESGALRFGVVSKGEILYSLLNTAICEGGMAEHNNYAHPHTNF